MVSRLAAGAALAVTTVIVASGPPAAAQDLEPRTYANTPVGVNFLVLGYAYSRGDVVIDPAAPIEDAELTVHGAVLAYARALDIWGRAGKLELAVPYAGVTGTATVAGQRREWDVTGLGDLRGRFSVLLYGAPALSLTEFASYTPDLIVGARVTVTAPVGQYDADRLVNIGTNRWSVRPELGASKTLGPWTLELSTSITLFTDTTSSGAPDAGAGPRLHRADARHLPHALGRVGGDGCHLLHGRAHDGRRPAGSAP